MGLAAEVYAEQLLPKAHGLPLWIPEPSKFGEVLIGDVGYVHDGSFYRLFNVTYPKDDPVNHGEVPDDFEVLEYNPRLLHRVEHYLDAGPICSKSVKRVDVAASGSSDMINAGLGYRFSCAHDQGALLILKTPASQEVVHPNRAFRDYMRVHHASWCEFARARGLDIDPDHIILVRGWVKTAAWAVAAFTDSGKNHEVNFDASAGPFAKASFSVSYSSAVSMSVEHRTGPVKHVGATSPYNTGENQPPRDQCVFLSYYEMKSRVIWGKKKIKAAAEPLDDFDDKPPDIEPTTESQSERASDYSDVEEDRPASKFVDPVGYLLQYILQNSDATNAIASDEDVHRVLPDDRWPADIPSYLESTRPHISVDENMTGFLSIGDTSVLEDNISHQLFLTHHSTSPIPSPSNVGELSFADPLSKATWQPSDEVISSLDPNELNATVVMPTPKGGGNDPPQEGETERQTPMVVREQSSSPPTTPTSAPRVRLRGIPGWTVPPKVLLVDDDAVCRKLSSKLLRVFGCFIDVAVDGVGAVNMMNLEKYDLVFMDIVMPKLDGVSATSLIRQFDHLTPIISMTSNSKPNEVVKYYSSGMNDILSKPFTKDDLLQKLEKHLIHLKAAHEEFRRLSRSPSVSSHGLIGNADQLLGMHSALDTSEPEDDTYDATPTSQTRKRSRGAVESTSRVEVKRRRSDVAGGTVPTTT